ncbi:MAG: hypothetical protein K0S51_389 [Bacillales bacterium]|jgi:hypothetical protein|nr:hypothetical protein [Bacillales bacterium]
MDRMFRVLGFWTAIFAIMFFVGDLYEPAAIFAAQTAIFVVLGYLNLTEKMYSYIFMAYLTICFIGFTYYTTFIMS